MHPASADLDSPACVRAFHQDNQAYLIELCGARTDAHALEEGRLREQLASYCRSAATPQGDGMFRIVCKVLLLWRTEVGMQSACRYSLETSGRACLKAALCRVPCHLSSQQISEIG